MVIFSKFCNTGIKWNSKKRHEQDQKSQEYSIRVSILTVSQNSMTFNKYGMSELLKCSSTFTNVKNKVLFSRFSDFQGILMQQ